jgi:hypothetical protein
MFGVLKGASCALKDNERQEWMGHICGTCLALRDNAGQASRIVTNYDAALMSVLCEAQNPTPPERYISRCPLRHNFKAEVTAPDSVAAQYAASVALMMASTKIQDHVADNETFLRHISGLSTRLAHNWSATGGQLAKSLGFGPDAIEVQTRRQAYVESEPNRDFFFYAQPTELAVAAAFQHTAVIANRPQNADILYEIGRMFGRIMYLLDSYEDYVNDLAAKKFNALAACFEETKLSPQVKQIFQETYKRLKHLFHQLDLVRPTLAHKLLIQQLKQRSYKVLELGSCPTCSCRLPTTANAAMLTGTGTVIDSAPGSSFGIVNLFKRRRKRIRPRRRVCGCCEALLCCDCCTECCCCCDWDLCDCEDGGCEFCECECCECCECSCCQCCGDEKGCCDCDCG